LLHSLGLSPIVGAFTVGMTVTSVRIIQHMHEYVDKLQIIFASWFFALIGLEVDLRSFNLDVLTCSVMIARAVATKLIGCRLPSIIFLKDKAKALGVEVGMVSRGEGDRSLLVSECLQGRRRQIHVNYDNIMMAVTTIIRAMWLKYTYRKEPTAEPSQSANPHYLTLSC
jgi:Kef-type K+ transport system membrane component KefB